jgi:predicted lipoprotein with Yx(FWY)xxD motif
VTYNGHPLYRYAGDQHAGETAGQGLDQFGAEWYVLSPAGNQVTDGADNGSGS